MMVAVAVKMHVVNIFFSISIPYFAKASKGILLAMKLSDTPYAILWLSRIKCEWPSIK